MRAVEPAGPPAIVCFSNLDWDWLRYRKQHLMARLARRFPVVYVNPPRACKWRRPVWRRTTRHGGGLQVHEPLVLPGRTWDAVHRWNDRLIARALERLVPPGRPVISWIYSPHALGLSKLLRPDRLVYDMADDYTAPSGARLRDRVEARELARLAALEERILRSADLVLCASEPLLARARPLARSAHLVPNACDFDRYRDPVLRRPAGWRPRIGYVGTVAPRVDLSLLVRIARERPDWDVEIVGPVCSLPEADACPRLSNLHWKGPVPYDEVPATIESLDVGILPLLEIAFATQASPIQVYDYLAAGKPVVSTPVVQLQGLPHLVTTAHADGFVAAIERALASDSADRIAARRVFARANSWDTRVDRILGLLASAEIASGPEREVA